MRKDMRLSAALPARPFAPSHPLPDFASHFGASAANLKSLAGPLLAKAPWLHLLIYQFFLYTEQSRQMKSPRRIAN
jgi:hypothetical protein